MSRIAVDLDGTLIAKSWPDLGDWFRDATWAMRTLHEAGHHLYLYTARLNPCWPDGSERDPGEFEAEVLRVRAKLDMAGLEFMDIFMDTKQGKPHWDLLIDDKVMWFPGRPGSWKSMVPKILARLEDEDSFQTVMDVAAFGGVTADVLSEVMSEPSGG